MSARVQKTSVVVLAVQFNQCLGQGAQHLARAPAVIDPSRFTPLLGIHTAQDQFVSTGQSCLGQNSLCRMIGRDVEPRRYLALLSSRSHQIGPAAPP